MSGGLGCHLTSHSDSIYSVVMVLQNEHLQRCCTWVPTYNKPPALLCSLIVSLWENRRHHMLLPPPLGSLWHCVCICHPLDVIPSSSFTVICSTLCSSSSSVSLLLSSIVLNDETKALVLNWVLSMVFYTCTPLHLLLEGSIVLFTPLHLFDSHSYWLLSRSWEILQTKYTLSGHFIRCTCTI